MGRSVPRAGRGNQFGRCPAAASRVRIEASLFATPAGDVSHARRSAADRCRVRCSGGRVGGGVLTRTAPVAAAQSTGSVQFRSPGCATEVTPGPPDLSNHPLPHGNPVTTAALVRCGECGPRRYRLCSYHADLVREALVGNYTAYCEHGHEAVVVRFAE
jgi:hypothetical protein